MALEIINSPLYSDANLQGYWRMENAEDSNTRLLLHFDGADASTSILNSGNNASAFTCVGNAQIDTAQYKFGNASLLLDGNGDYITTPDNADWALGTGDFTIDLWARFSDVAVDQGFCGQWVDDNNLWRWMWTGGNLYFQQKVGGTVNIAVTAAWSPSVNTWYHIAVTRASNVWRIFVDGTQVGTDVTETDSIADIASVLYVGTTWLGGVSSMPFKGWMDEFRWVKAAARYTANFTAPTTSHKAGGEDYSANKYHLSQYNGYISKVSSMFGLGMDFESSTSHYISIVDASCPNLEIAGAKTYVGWFKFESHTAASYPMAKANTPLTTLTGIRYHPTGGIGFLSSGLTTITEVNSEFQPTDGLWYHIAGVYTGSKLQVYINTTLYEVNATGNSTDTNGDFSIGRLGSVAVDYYFDGVADDCAVFNRALTAAEIESLYLSTGAKVMLID